MKRITVEKDLLLIPVSLASAEVIYDSIDQSRTHLRTWLPFVDKTRSVSDTRTFIKSVLHSAAPKKDEIWEIWSADRFAGLIGLKEIDYPNKKVEIGYWLDGRMTGKGIMGKACRALTDFVFSQYKLNRIMIKVATGNIRSIKIPESLGFTFEGIERDGEYTGQGFYDLRVYSMLKKEWEK
jgi:ribosomal-protein-serine acetyltransferase